MECIIKGLSVSFGSITVLRDITFRLPSSGVVALIGPNGSGKSTLLDVLSGEVEPTAGEIRSATSNSLLSQAARQRLSTRLYQVLLIPECISIAEYVNVARCEGAIRRLMAPRRNAVAEFDWFRKQNSFINDALSAAGIDDGGMSIGQLSWGQRRLVAILGAVATPKTLLLDEPLAGLGRSVNEAVVNIIQSEAAKRLVVVAEHDLDVVRKVGERILVLRHGSVVCEYGPGELEEVGDLLEHWWEESR
jgi:branched-chain amino acid transport system ATP-binding protein